MWLKFENSSNWRRTPEPTSGYFVSLMFYWITGVSAEKDLFVSAARAESNGWEGIFSASGICDPSRIISPGEGGGWDELF